MATSPDIPKTTWLWEKIASKSFHKNTRIISLVFGLEANVFVDKGVV